MHTTINYEIKDIALAEQGKKNIDKNEIIYISKLGSEILNLLTTIKLLNTSKRM